ncbi:MAG: ABC transporter substrate-binding protein [Puniceicoccales bacterium]|jgi:polar amino acid transport system substrate-binding protein|nr:ABC transporter substrate-binding protein [Puniceicoccales bacterium]
MNFGKDMKKYILWALLFTVAAAIVFVSFNRKNGEKSNTIRFGTSADYPPMEYYREGKMTGFEIELAELIAEKLGKNAIFDDMNFDFLSVALEKGFIDVIIAAFGVTPESRKKFDFTLSYYPEKMVFLHKKSDPIGSQGQLSRKKIIYQLSGRIKKCLEEKLPHAELVSMDKMGLAVESLKAGQTECVYMDVFVAEIYCKENPELTYFSLDSLRISEGIAMALPKGSPLKNEINETLKNLESSGELRMLEDKWGLKETWKLADE